LDLASVPGGAFLLTEIPTAARSEINAASYASILGLGEKVNISMITILPSGISAVTPR
jgi:hypothetical protein